jgi:hypothetical protein
MILSGGRLITLEQAKRIRVANSGQGKPKRKKHRHSFRRPVWKLDDSKRETFQPCVVEKTSNPFCVFGANGESPVPEVSMGGEVSIYVLIDPRDDTVRYVGRSVDPKTRLAYHIADSTGRKREWIHELKAEGILPRMEIVDRASWSEWESAEQQWIQFYASRGGLYNVEVGGRGYLYKKKHKRRNKHGHKKHVWRM